MRFRSVLVLVAATATACGGDEGVQPMPDAKVATRACEGRAYDLCTDTTAFTDCMSGLECHFYRTQNFTICSPSCDANNPCPADENGTAVECNKNGRCRSDAPNACFQ